VLHHIYTTSTREGRGSAGTALEDKGKLTLHLLGLRFVLYAAVLLLS
jgi:hypothetical protein